MRLRKAWIIIACVVLSAYEARTSSYGRIIPSGNLDGSPGVSAAGISTSDNTKDLVLVGTVTKIYPVAGLLRKWAVVAQIDRVIAGEFTGTTFTFTVHSPTLSGLRVGRSYTIKATWTGDSYAVDQYQWMPANGRRKSSRKH